MTKRSAAVPPRLCVGRAPTTITILGLDPGLSHTGFAVAEIDPARGTILRTLELGCITTVRDNHAQIRRTSDDYRRARCLFTEIHAVVARHNISVAASEMMTTTPYVRPSLNFGILLGVIASFDFFLIELLPREIKKATVGNRDASKETIIRWAVELTSRDDLDWPTSARKNKMGVEYRGKHVTLAAEHQADALAVIQAAARSEQLRNSMSLQHALTRK